MPFSIPPMFLQKVHILSSDILDCKKVEKRDWLRTELLNVGIMGQSYQII
jgi:hypothetical protein